MSASKKPLGRGLGALLKTTVVDKPDYSSVIEVGLENIVANPFQPRRTFTEESIQELAESIQKNGLLQPILVRKVDQGYEIVSGERRFRAFGLLGKNKIPAIIKNYSDQEMVTCALVENIQRENLNPIEEAFSYKQLAEDYQLTHEQLARQLGKSRTHVTNSLRLLKLPTDLVNYVESGLLSSGAARAILSLKDVEKQKKAALEAIHQGLNVRQVEKYVKEVSSPANTSKNADSNSDSATEQNSQNAYALEFEKVLQLSCKFTMGSKKSKLQIEFQNAAEIEQLLDRLKNNY